MSCLPNLIISAAPGEMAFTKLFPEMPVNEVYLVRGFAIMKDEHPIAACCVYRNPSIKQEGKEVLLIGRFSCANDIQLCHCLLEACAAFAASSGIEYLLGPMNGSTWEDYRFAVEGASPRFFTEPEQRDYYPALWKTAGFLPVENYFSAEAKLADIPAEWGEYKAAIKEAGISISTPAADNWIETVKSLYPLCSKAFSGAAFYSPVTEEYFVRKYSAISKVWQPELILIARDSYSQPVAFMLAIPNHSDKSGNSFVLKTMAKHPEATTKGLIPYMTHSLYIAAHRMGYTTIIHAFMHAGNRSQHRSAQAKGAIIRRYALFAKSISA